MQAAKEFGKKMHTVEVKCEDEIQLCWVNHVCIKNITTL